NIVEEVPDNHAGPLWPLVRPISNFHSEILTADSACLALFCDGKSDDFLHKATDLISLRNSISTMLDRYNRDREELSLLTAPYAAVVPGQLHATFAIDARERPDIIVKINAIESLIGSIRDMLESTRALANEVSALYPEVAKRIAGKNFKVRFETVVPDKLTPGVT
ncbi:MAG TPA: hypothetical protein PKV67_17370, partial [Hyphomonas sp.]|nr:hypothetical protein [Hyphomonas sp.]